jgi:glutathione S-transferase
VGDDEPACRAIVAGTTRQLDAMFDWIDSELEGREYVLGEFSGVDLYLHMVTRWGRNLPRKAWSLPNVGAHYALLSERPSVARMMQRQGIAAYPEQ